jgi:hypothetical protein
MLRRNHTLLPLPSAPGAAPPTLDARKAALDQQLRTADWIEFTSMSGGSTAIVEVTQGREWAAQLGVLQSCCVVLIFISTAVVFKMVVDDTVVVPIEKVTGLLKRLSTTLTCLAGEIPTGSTEMQHIKIAFRKMGGLLVKVYGEAGASTIKKNLAGGSTELDPMIAGTQRAVCRSVCVVLSLALYLPPPRLSLCACVGARHSLVPIGDALLACFLGGHWHPPPRAGTKADFIFGFCDIREFTAATECLQEDVMLFVNGVGQIVHDIVADNGG